MGDTLGENVDLAPIVKGPVIRHFRNFVISDWIRFGYDILEALMHISLKGKGLHAGENRNTTRPSPIPCWWPHNALLPFLGNEWTNEFKVIKGNVELEIKFNFAFFKVFATSFERIIKSLQTPHPYCGMGEGEIRHVSIILFFLSF